MSFSFELVQPIKEHAECVFRWRNDPVTRENSFHKELKEWEPFYFEFQSYFRFPDLPPIFIVQENERIAFLRFDPVEDFADQKRTLQRRCCSLSINVAPSVRGKGFGTAILIQVKKWIEQQGYEALYGEVKINNTVSRKAFLNAGFRELPESVKVLNDERIPIVRFVAEFVSTAEESPVLIVAEAGSNWRMGNYKNDLIMAKRLIALAAEAGVNAVKFQVFRPETIYVKNAGNLQSYDIEESMQELFSEVMMPYEMIAELHAECQKQKVSFMATAFSPTDFFAVDPFVEQHKIASYELNYPELLMLAAKSKKPVLLSTGASNEEEIAWAVNAFYDYGGRDLTLLQCTACYPAPPNSMNLNCLTWMKQRYQVQVGLSDHSEDPVLAAVMAVALGAKVIEKHFTLNRLLPGPDHSFAITPKELKSLVIAVRQAEEMKGSYVKGIHPSEYLLRQFARRGIQAIQEINEGELLIAGKNIAILRPGNQLLGMHPKYLPQIEGKRAKHLIHLGQGIQLDDFL